MPETEETLLDKLLQDKDDAFKARILYLVISTGIEPDDPLFLFFVGTGRLEVLIEDAPKALEQLLKNWAREFWRAIELTEGVIVERQKEAIAKAAKALIESAPTSATSAPQSSKLMTWGVPAIIAFCAFLGGTVGGILSPTEAVADLSSRDRQLLSWAKSEEGIFAKNLIKWNESYLKDCQKEARALDLELAGSKDGFCVLFVEEPKK